MSYALLLSIKLDNKLLGIEAAGTSCWSSAKPKAKELSFVIIFYFLFYEKLIAP